MKCVFDFFFERYYIKRSTLKDGNRKTKRKKERKKEREVERERERE